MLDAFGILQRVFAFLSDIDVGDLLFIQQLFLKELQLSVEVLEYFLERLGFLVGSIRFLLDFGLVRIFARLVRVVVEIFSLEQHFFLSQLLNVVFQLAVIRVS